MPQGLDRRSRVAELLPGLGEIRRYQRGWLRADLVGGLTVGAMLVPQSMAYAELAGLAPEYGFYAVMGALVVYALVGTSRHLGVGPEPGTAILAATGVGAIAAGDPERYVALMAGLALVVAAICVVAAAARGVVAATVVVAAFGLDGHGISLVGDIPTGLPVPGLPDVSVGDVGRLLPVAAGIALVGYSDNVLTARSIAARQGYRIDANQELLALGLTNLTAGLSQGFPVSSSASRTAVPASLGTRTQLVSLVASASVVATVLVLAPVLGEIPRAALAAVIVSAAIAILDVPGFRALWRVSREEAVLAAVAALGVVVFDVLVGVLVAVSLSIVVAFHRIARPHDAVLGDYPGLEGWVASTGTRRR